VLRVVSKNHVRERDAAGKRINALEFDLAEVKRVYASIIAQKGDFTKARRWYSEALKTLTELYGEEHSKARAVKAQLASLMRAEELHIPAFKLYD
ncbi:hypothetical protein T484DRAFT_1773266, partial [Baffinella frigidus]